MQVIAVSRTQCRVNVKVLSSTSGSMKTVETKLGAKLTNIAVIAFQFENEIVLFYQFAS